MDVGDNIGGGSAADSTILLREALSQRDSLAGFPYLQSIYDPHAAAACAATGVGGTLELSLGGHTDDLHGEPLEVTSALSILRVLEATDLCYYAIQIVCPTWCIGAFHPGHKLVR